MGSLSISCPGRVSAHAARLGTLQGMRVPHRTPWGSRAKAERTRDVFTGTPPQKASPNSRECPPRSSHIERLTNNYEEHLAKCNADRRMIGRPRWVFHIFRALSLKIASHFHFLIAREGGMRFKCWDIQWENTTSTLRCVVHNLAYSVLHRDSHALQVWGSRGWTTCIATLAPSDDNPPCSPVIANERGCGSHRDSFDN